MSNKIISIKKENNVKLDEKYMRYDGYSVETEEDKYMILIDNEQSCCEDWGYLSSEDNLNDFIGKELVEVYTTDTELRTTNIDLHKRINGLETNTMFVTFKCSDATTFQLVAYNDHNGYYGHKVKLIKNNITIEDEVL